jgi:hypothetical protein
VAVHQGSRPLDIDIAIEPYIIIFAIEQWEIKGNSGNKTLLLALYLCTKEKVAIKEES